MKSLIGCVLFLLLTGSAAAEPQVIIDTDFGVPGKAFEEIDRGEGHPHHRQPGGGLGRQHELEEQRGGRLQAG